MDYRPNIDAVAWFARQVLPQLRAQHPAARFAIVGRAPTREVTALAALPGVIVTGAVDDVRGWIAAADVVLYDRLIPPGALDGARPDAELRYVGKEPGRPAVAQEEINRQLVELGGGGRRVVRLKGGDPFVFGRGGEEAEALAAAGVPFEVVPGVTAGVAAPAYAGIPVTHRDAASAVAFVTVHEDPSKDGSAPAASSWPNPART